MNPEIQKIEVNGQLQIPAANWANWALIEAHAANPNHPELLQFIAQRFAQTVSERKGGPRCVVIATGAGYWSRGESIADAAKKCKGDKTARVQAWLILNDNTAELNAGGTVLAENVATIISLGVVGTINSIIKANKDL